MSGLIPNEIRPIFFGANLLALTKKDGGLRPIAVGDTLRRLTAKCALDLIRNRLFDLVGPQQYGISIKNGAEIIVHAASEYVGAMPPTQVFVKLDFRNSFNSIRRDRFLTIAADKVPELYPFINSCYEQTTLLSYDEHTLFSAEGAQQGDPLSGLLFSLVLRSLTDDLRSSFNAWYLDDGSLGDEWDVVVDDLRSLIPRCEKVGLHLNPEKCEIINDALTPEVLNSFQQLLPGIKVTQLNQLKLLGAPIGEQATQETLLTKKAELQRMCTILNFMGSHEALYLLRHALFIPKLLYILRTSHSYRLNDILVEYDKSIQAALSTVLNINFDDMAWLQAIGLLYLKDLEDWEYGCRQSSLLPLSSPQGMLPLSNRGLFNLC